MTSGHGRARVVTVIGTRPEIIKCSPLLPRFDDAFDHALVHTGQHYDDGMDASFFRELGLRPPDHGLNVGSGAPVGQMARMLLGLEPILTERRPDLVFVQGDTNSTLAGALAAAKLNVPVAHLEAGCRSFNRAMPEETNRVLVDHLAAICLAPDEIARRNLLAEGIDPRRIAIVGSTGIDACLRATALPVGVDPAAASGLERGGFLVATIHRAENTTPERLAGLLDALEWLSRTWPVIFPVHPRTAGVLEKLPRPGGITFTDPVGYGQMLQLLVGCRALLTDSGGLQEEAAVLGTPTFILRDETEWMAFVEAGRHILVGTDPDRITRVVNGTLVGGEREQQMREPYGLERQGADGRTMQALLEWFGSAASMEVEGHHQWRQPVSNVTMASQSPQLERRVTIR